MILRLFPKGWKELGEACDVMQLSKSAGIKTAMPFETSGRAVWVSPQPRRCE